MAAEAVADRGPVHPLARGPPEDAGDPRRDAGRPLRADRPKARQDADEVGAEVLYDGDRVANDVGVNGADRVGREVQGVEHQRDPGDLVRVLGVAAGSQPGRFGDDPLVLVEPPRELPPRLVGQRGDR